MDDDDLFEDDEYLQCDDCGRYYPKNTLKICRVCGEIICEECRKTHPNKHKQPIINPNRMEGVCQSIDRFVYQSLARVWKRFSLNISGFKVLANIIIISLAVFGALSLAGYLPDYDNQIIQNPSLPEIPEEEAVEPHIVVDEEYTGITARTLDFEWRGERYFVTAEVDTAIYKGAGNDESDVYSGNLEEYYVRKATDVLQDDFYEDVLSDLRQIRTNLNLDSDEYIELIASFVQDIGYDEDASVNVRYPVAVFFDGLGDCDEKSLLLCGLLAREGYDVALLDFPEINHMSAGIRAGDLSDGYVDGYLFLESTGSSLVGEVPFEDADKNPEYFRVGDGHMRYLKYPEVKAILAYRDSMYDFLDGWVIYEGDVISKIKYENYETIYYYLHGELNAGEREKAYSLVVDNPLIYVI